MRHPLFLTLCIAAAVCTAASPTDAQTLVTVRQAELAVPFGSAQGQLAVAGDQLVFLSQQTPEASIAIARAEIRNLVRSGDTVTITTRQPLRDPSGTRDTFRFRLSEPSDLVGWYERGPMAATASSASPAAPAAGSGVLESYQVKHDHRIGSCQGRLILTEDRLAFESIDEIDDSRQWELADLKEVRQNGIYKLRVVPFVGDTFNFELVGKGMDSGVYRRLVDRIAQARSTR